jgi:hypothetical protein
MRQLVAYLEYRVHWHQTQHPQDKCMQQTLRAVNQSPHIFGHCYMGCSMYMDFGKFQKCMQALMGSRGPLCILVVQ